MGVATGDGAAEFLERTDYLLNAERWQGDVESCGDRAKEFDLRYGNGSVGADGVSAGDKRSLFDWAAGGSEFLERSIKCDKVEGSGIEFELRFDQPQLARACRETGLGFGEIAS